MTDSHAQLEVFDARVVVMMPANLKSAIERAARKTFATPSQYIRDAVLAQFERDGVTIARRPPRSAMPTVAHEHPTARP